MKIRINNKQKYFGTQDTKTGLIEINKKLSKTKNRDGSPKHDKYPGLADTIKHELLHAKYPKLSEGQTDKKTAQAIKHMGKKAKAKLYSMLPNSDSKKKVKKSKIKHKEMLPGSSVSHSEAKPVTKKDRKLSIKHLKDDVKLNRKHAKDHLKAASKGKKKGEPKGSIAYNQEHGKHHLEAYKEALKKLNKLK